MKTTARVHHGYRHEALLYRGVEEFLAATLPFVRDGVRMGQPVLVAVGEPRLGLLREALGADAADVEFVDMAELGANPARIIPRWQLFVEQFSGPGRPVRGVGEPIWAGRGPVDLVECQLHEALLNIAVAADTPLWLVCPYDVGALPTEVIEEAGHSHPVLVDAEGYRGSTRYEGLYHVDALLHARLPEPEVRTDLPVDEQVDTVRFGAGDLTELERRVSRHAVAAGIGTDRALGLTAAMAHIAEDRLRHGAGDGVLRVWQETGALVCEIRDGADLGDPLLGRRVTEPGRRGWGVWFANEVCDLTQVRATDGGTVVRVHCRI